jgi:hypothetical protein
MAAFSFYMSGIELCLLPLLAVVCLVASKITQGPRGRLAERFFVAILLLATFACLRTMLAGETLWLVHAVTMALMIVGSVSVPAAACRSREAAMSPVIDCLPR